MMRHLLPGMGILAVLLLSVTAPRAHAQEGGQIALHSLNGPNNAYGPNCTGEPPSPRGWYPGRYVLLDPLGRPSAIGCVCKSGCWASIRTMGCGSLKQECTFIFGSCRSFYGEPCLNGPPPPVAPPGSTGGYYPPPGCPSCPR